MRGLVAAAAAATAACNSVWPLPPAFNQGGGAAIPLDANFVITCPGACPDPLTAAIARYTNLIYFAGAPGATSGTTITGLVVNASASAPLALGVSENYTLSVPSGGVATLTAATQWGALRGLESFSQLVQWSTAGPANVYSVAGTPIAITDYPRFPWRGFLIDTSRHYLTVSAIKATLDAASYYKMNRMHWHVVDDNSWPLVSQTYPNFSAAGAYAPDAIYTHADVSDIVTYAYERGISVVPEFDMPAHADAWGRGYPNLIISCDGGQPLLDPTDGGGVYDTLTGLLAEFVPLFNTDFIHLGGDEVSTLQCWQQSPEVQAFAKAKGFTTMDEVRNYFESKIQSIAASFNLSVIFWEEVYDAGYDLLPSTIIDVWLSDDKLLSIIASGHRVVESFGGYLDQQLPYGDTHYFWVDTALNFYLHDPLFNVTVPPAQAALVMGLSASQWGEQVNAANIQSRMWPRGGATAYRMWSDANARDTTSFFSELDTQTCHLQQRGIGAGPIRPSDQTVYCPLPMTSRFHHQHVDWSVPVRGG